MPKKFWRCKCEGGVLFFAYPGQNAKKLVTCKLVTCKLQTNIGAILFYENKDLEKRLVLIHYQAFQRNSCLSEYSQKKHLLKTGVKGPSRGVMWCMMPPWEFGYLILVKLLVWWIKVGMNIMNNFVLIRLGKITVNLFEK